MYLRLNQDKIRAECYQNVHDAVHVGDLNAGDLGKRIILPATHIGSPRYMYNLFHDSMTLVRVFGKPDLFITMTCNPKWKEILDVIGRNGKAADNPDIVSRVFNIKLTAMMKDIKNGIFGEILGHCYTIEFQKRGLPHAHILIWLENKPEHRDTIDDIVCCEIPDPNVHPLLYQKVKQHMMHGPCGISNPNCPCMDKDKLHCTKRYPKKIINETFIDNKGETIYRRRNTAGNGNVI